jgi:hypothetical protein
VVSKEFGESNFGMGCIITRDKAANEADHDSSWPPV